MMIFLLKSAQNVEHLIETNVFRLNEIMVNIISIYFTVFVLLINKVFFF